MPGILERQQLRQALFAERRLGCVDELHHGGAPEDVEVAGKWMVDDAKPVATSLQTVPRVVQPGQPALVEAQRRRGAILGLVHARMDEDQGNEDR